MISVPEDSRESPGTKIIFYVILRRKSQEKRMNKRGAPKHMKKTREKENTRKKQRRRRQKEPNKPNERLGDWYRRETNNNRNKIKEGWKQETCGYYFN
jgi:hypothetical protein